MSELFKINASAVVSEIIDGEAVIMNLTSGNYFSTMDSGCLIWGWLEQDVSLATVTRRLSNMFDVAPLKLSATLNAFLADLLSNELIVVTDMGAPESEDTDPEVTGRAAFQAPVLAMYTDMQDVLLLDPIHDVDSVGWPTVASDTDVASEQRATG